MSKVSLGEKAYQILLEKLVNCEYEPNAFLTEDELAITTGMSRTPLREAIHQLEFEKFVEIYPKRGIQVSKISPSRVRELFEIREVIEPYIIQNYGDRIEPNILRQEIEILKGNDILLQSDEMNDYKHANNIDQDFHWLLLNACGNQFLLSEMRQVLYHCRRCNIFYRNSHKFFKENQNDDRIEQTGKEHIAILEKLLLGEYNTAAKLMRKHLVNAEKALLSGFINKFNL